MINVEESTLRNAQRKNFIHFPSALNHLRDHNGFRPEELHVLIGPKGGGKSSLFRTWIAECLFNEKRVYTRLSEERAQAYQDEIVVNLAKGMPNVDGLESLKIDSEMDMTEGKGAEYFDDLTLRIRNFAADILFFDNFTTSELSEGNIGLQGKNARALRMMALKLKIPVIVACHTEKGFKSGSIATGDNARGNMTLSNMAAYIYSINVVQKNKPAVLFVDKARHHTESNKSLYLVDFEPKVGLYIGDKKSSYAEVAQLLKGAPAFKEAK